MHFHNGLADSQAKTVVLGALTRRVRTVKTLKQMWQVLCGDARALVTKNEARIIALQSGGDENDDRDGADGPRSHPPSVGKAGYQHDAAYEDQTPGKLPRMRQLALMTVPTMN